MPRPTPPASSRAAKRQARAWAADRLGRAGRVGDDRASRGDLVCVTATSAGESCLPLALSATSCALDGGL